MNLYYIIVVTLIIIAGIGTYFLAKSLNYEIEKENKLDRLVLVFKAMPKFFNDPWRKL